MCSTNILTYVQPADVLDFRGVVQEVLVAGSGDGHFCGRQQDLQDVYRGRSVWDIRTERREREREGGRER